MKIKILSLAVAAIASIMIFKIILFNHTTNPLEMEIKNAIESNNISTEYNDLLKDALSVLSKVDNDFKKIVVSREPNKKEVALILIDTNTPYVRNETNYLSIAEKNMLAVGGKYIIADKNLIDLMLLNASISSSAELILKIESSKKVPNTNLIRSNVEQLRTRQLANTREFLKGNLKEINIDYGRAYRDLKKEEFREFLFEEIIVHKKHNDPVFMKKYNIYFPGLIMYILSDKYVSPKDFPMHAALVFPLSSVLFAPISHELKHIEDEETGAFLDDVINASKLKEIKIKENQADNYAISKIKKALSSSSLFELEIAKQNIGSNILFSSRFFSDLLLTKRMKNFRSLPQYATAIDIFYEQNRSCDDGGVTGYFDFEDITDIKPAIPPLLTVNEVKNINNEILNEKYNTHPHEISRRINFDRINIIKPEEEYQINSAFDQGLLSIVANSTSKISSNDFQKLYSNWNFIDTNDIGISGNWFDFIQNKYSLKEQSVAFCPFDKCKIYTHSYNYFEIGYMNNNIVYFSFFFPWFQPDASNMEIENREIPSLQRMEDQFNIFKYTIKSLAREIENQNKLNIESGKFISDLARCGGGSFFLKEKNHTIYANTLDEHFSFKLTYVFNEN